MRNSYEVRAQKFIKQIYPFLKDYGVFCGLENPIEKCEDAVRAFNIEKKRKAQWYYGSTRIVIASSDYVIKIDYNDDTDWGNCETELKNWKNYYSSCRYSDHFAPISKYTYLSHDFYIMPRINNIGNVDICKVDKNFAYWANNNVGDIHEEQYGKKNGKVIFIDYAVEI